jgi:hypothetical protein
VINGSPINGLDRIPPEGDDRTNGLFCRLRHDLPLFLGSTQQDMAATPERCSPTRGNASVSSSFDSREGYGFGGPAAAEEPRRWRPGCSR